MRERAPALSGHDLRVDVEELLRQRGGLATRAELLSAAPRADVDRALRQGRIVAAGRGRYVLADTDQAAVLALAVGGVLCLTSAALHHGWEVKHTPERPHVVVPRGRRLPLRSAPHVQLHRRDLHPDEIDGVATSIETTLEMCLRLLPFDEALAIADSFLRHGGRPGLLRGIAHSARGHGAAQMRRVAREADGDADNPFESVLRAIALDVEGLHVRPQVTIRSTTMWARPDLVDVDLCIVLEADSFKWHGQRDALDRDAVRYNRMVTAGWAVLRFTWEQVMFRPQEVRLMIELLVQRLSQPCTCGRSSA